MIMMIMIMVAIDDDADNDNNTEDDDSAGGTVMVVVVMTTLMPFYRNLYIKTYELLKILLQQSLTGRIQSYYVDSTYTNPEPSSGTQTTIYVTGLKETCSHITLFSFPLASRNITLTI